MPLILDIVENIGTKRVFTKIDLWWGYNNVQIKEGNKWKAVFMMPEESFEPTMMFFGLTNSPVIFQTMMNEILWDLINTSKVASFIDNVIIGMEGKEGHDELVEEVVRRLAENNLYVKPEKCKWKVKEVEFLEVVIGSKGIKMEEEKIKEVLDWLIPECVKDIQKFLGLANYYYQFIKDFVSIVQPLYDLVKKEQKWKWTERQQKVFKELKERFTKKLVSAVLDLDKKIRIEVDVSDYVTRGVLSMECEDRKWRLVAFLSKSLNKMERNYEIYNKEVLVVVRGDYWKVQSTNSRSGPTIKI